MNLNFEYHPKCFSNFSFLKPMIHPLSLVCGVICPTYNPYHMPFMNIILLYLLNYISMTLLTWALECYPWKSSILHHT